MHLRGCRTFIPINKSLCPLECCVAFGGGVQVSPNGTGSIPPTGYSTPYLARVCHMGIGLTKPECRTGTSDAKISPRYRIYPPYSLDLVCTQMGMVRSVGVTGQAPVVPVHRHHSSYGGSFLPMLPHRDLFPDSPRILHRRGNCPPASPASQPPFPREEHERLEHDEYGHRNAESVCPYRY